MVIGEFLIFQIMDSFLLSFALSMYTFGLIIIVRFRS